MKLFDHKLLLIIGLAIVIYLMYREISNLKNRIDSLENTKNSNTIQHNQPQFLDFNPNMNNLENNPENNLDNNLNKIENENILPNKSCTISTEEESEIQNYDERDAVEIYSNDNIEEESSANTSIEKSEEKVENYDLINENNNIDSTIENQTAIINMILQSENESANDSENDSENDSADNSANEINYENINLESKNSITNSPILNKSEAENDSPITPESSEENKNLKLSEKSDSNKSDSNKSDSNKSDSNKSDSNKSDSPLENVNPDDLIKNNKLSELKEMAEKLNIELKNNGKNKTKKQLANEICQVKNH